MTLREKYPDAYEDERANRPSAIYDSNLPPKENNLPSAKIDCPGRYTPSAGEPKVDGLFSRTNIADQKPNTGRTMMTEEVMRLQTLVRNLRNKVKIPRELLQELLSDYASATNCENRSKQGFPSYWKAKKLLEPTK